MTARSTATLPSAASPASLSALQATAARDPKAAVKEAARQFEALFMQELLKSMRASTSGGPLDNSGSQMGTDMLDQHYALQLSGRPGGLSEAIARQLERQIGVPAPSVGSASAGRVSSASAGSARAQPAGPGAEGFVRQHTEAAKAAERDSGIPSAFILGQAAHESGWGRKEILKPDGSTSYNLFGIKAGPGWNGKTTDITTTEYVNGEPRKVTARFRAYDSYEESFKDYARMLKNSPRYAGVVANADTPQEFATGLQRAGYATDPAYASKLSRVINMTLRLQRSQA